MLSGYKHRQRFNETALISAWPELMGPAVANRTVQIYIRDRRFFVKVDSSVVKNELIMMRSQIMDKLNDKAGSKVIDEVVFI